MSRRLIILGGGGHAHSVADVALSLDTTRQLLFVDPVATDGQMILGFPVIQEMPVDENSDYFVAIGNNLKRSELLDNITGQNIISIVANDAHIGKDVRLAGGVFIGHQAYIGPEVNIAEGVIINTRAIIEHEVSMDRYSQVGPQAIIAGRTKIGTNTFIGLAARVIDRLSIGPNVVVGAGAVVVKDIDSPGTYIGIPARRNNE